ncbi:NaCP60E [Symbiodinium natans]|uniref:NaCP60E protein n=1 Tax=Symbiodinium natans TaxID=878477 RepID=A0A812T8D0_9DINO|nr:NaCP60E [Symbiodinium natans]
MNNPTGLKKGLVQQWQAATSAMDKFQFLKSFLLDRDMADITVDAYYENETKERYVELPLCEIKEKYEKLPGGKEFVADIVANQKGKEHPQSKSEAWRIYKVFNCVDISSLLPQSANMIPNLNNQEPQTPNGTRRWQPDPSREQDDSLCCCLEEQSRKAWGR